MSRPETRLIKNPSDLVTSHMQVCKGFLAQALEKTERASPYIEQAKTLHAALNKASDIGVAASLKSVQAELLSAAGFSDKARSHLSGRELHRALKRAIDVVAKRAGDAWREDLVYRFLLTKGDSLGGTMRNVTGALAGIRFSDAIQEHLKASRIPHAVERSSTNEVKVQEITWKNRYLVFDKTPRFIRKNIDVILLKVLTPKAEIKRLLEDKKAYLACGELKGGIDPAGADEHWKTANSALERIRQGFRPAAPPTLFFVGAAIEAAMANEIFTQLQDGRLTHAANATVPAQVSDLAAWLLGL